MNRICLNGSWSFQIDPENQGKQNGWENSTEAFTGCMEVPGSWLLEETYQDYHGTAWYSRSFSLTQEQAQKQVTVCFGGAYRYADVYINGSFVLRHEGYQAAFEAKIRSFVKPGENRITVAVDEVRKDHDLMMEGSTVWGPPVQRFAGIYEPVWLELREDVRTSDVFATLSPELDKIRVQIETQNDTAQPQQAQLLVQIRQTDGEGPIKQQRIACELPQGIHTLEVEFDAADIKLWSPEEPNLYNINIQTVSGVCQDSYTQRTGFKYFTVRGKDFYLNGQPYFLRGYGDDFTYPMTGHPSATDKTFYYHGMQRAKDYGFNGARHHSHFPFMPFFEAADEMGLLIQPELAIANIPVDWFTEEHAQFFLKQWRALIKEHRHHPSVMSWCGGNEEEWGYFFEDRIAQTARQLDPTRPVMPTDGRWMGREIADDDNYDYVSVCYVEYTDVLPIDEYADLYTRDDCGKPQIVHEMTNFTTIRPIHDLPKYEGAKNYPYAWKKWAEEVGAAGRMDLYDRASANALALQKLCFKLVLENARNCDAIRGYHIWTIVDYYNTTQGLMNQFYEDKAFTAEEFARLNASSLLLWNTGRWCFTAGEKQTWKFDLSRFERDDWLDAKLSLSLWDKETVLQETCVCVDAAGHGTKALAQWKLELPQVDLARKLQLKAQLEAGENRIENQWDLWVYPAKPLIQPPTGRELFFHYLSRHMMEYNHRKLHHYTIPMPLNGSLLVTGFLMDGMLEQVAKGARMLLLAQPDTFKNTICRNSFKPCWWEQEEFFYINHSNNTQTSHIIEDHPALAGIPHENSWELNWFHLVEQQHAIDLEKLPFQVTPILYGLGKHLERRGYLFEFAYGDGAVLVCTLNFQKTNLKHPEVQYTFDRLLDYCDSDAFAPKHPVTPEQLREALNGK